MSRFSFKKRSAFRTGAKILGFGALSIRQRILKPGCLGHREFLLKPGRTGQDQTATEFRKKTGV